MNHEKKTPGWPAKTHPDAIKLQANPSTNASPCKKNFNTNIEWALFYAQNGWLVFPVHSVRGKSCTCRKDDCSNSGKHPRTRHGFKDATTDPKQIEEWWMKWPDANIGVATGRESGIAVIDVDIKNNGLENFDLLVHRFGIFPDTLVSETGSGGRHYFLKYPESGFNSTGGVLGPGIDTRGDGGYIIVPPSNHISGGQYRWKE